jgi:hypothetical protein
LPTKQGGLSLPEDLWKWIYDNYRKHGYQYHSQFVRKEMIEYALKYNSKLRNPSEKAVKTLERVTEIANIAERRRARKFSLVKSVDDYEEDIKGFKKLLKEGMISKEQYDKLANESREDHRKVVQLELLKDYNKPKKSLKEIRAEFKLLGVNIHWDKINDGFICDCCPNDVFEPDGVVDHITIEHGLAEEDRFTIDGWTNEVERAYQSFLKKKQRRD